MKAIVMREFGGPEVLRLVDVPDPVPAAGEALVRVGGVEVSRTRDVATRTGQHPFSRRVSLPHVLGGESSGTVEGVGEGVDPALIGRRVAVMSSHTCGRCVACRSGRETECEKLRMLGIDRWGSYAQLVTVPAELLFALPEEITLAHIAALSATGPVGLTQLRALNAEPGDWIAVTAATGALAATVAALARELGLHVLGLSRRPETVRSELGMTSLDTRDEQLADTIMSATGGRGVAGVVDNVGAPEVFDAYFPTIRNGGRVVVSGAIGSPALPTIRVPVAPLYSRSLSLIGVRTGSRERMQEFWDLVREGFRLPESVLHVRSLGDAALVHREVEDGTLEGHTVLVPPEE